MASKEKWDWAMLGQANVTLAEAREKAVEARRLLANGIDPIDARKDVKEKARTEEAKFGKFADDYVASHTNPVEQSQTCGSMEDDTWRSILLTNPANGNRDDSNRRHIVGPRASMAIRA